jgi:uncharacterized protein YegP (UPF0339 family)
VTRRARFVVYQDRAGEWRWRLLAANNRIVADSGEGYTRMRDCERAIAAALRATKQIAADLREGKR